MDRDLFVGAVQEVEAAGRAVCDAIDAALQALQVGARASAAGVPLVDIVDELIGAGGRNLRLATADAFHEFERALVEMRARVVCMLVEDGLSLTDVGRRLQISRQAVARLYRHGRQGRDQQECDLSP